MNQHRPAPSTSDLVAVGLNCTWAPRTEFIRLESQDMTSNAAISAEQRYLLPPMVPPIKKLTLPVHTGPCAIRFRYIAGDADHTLLPTGATLMHRKQIFLDFGLCAGCTFRQVNTEGSSPGDFNG